MNKFLTAGAAIAMSVAIAAPAFAASNSRTDRHMSERAQVQMRAQQPVQVQRAQIAAQPGYVLQSQAPGVIYNGADAPFGSLEWWSQFGSAD